MTQTKPPHEAWPTIRTFIRNILTEQDDPTAEQKTDDDNSNS